MSLKQSPLPEMGTLCEVSLHIHLKPYMGDEVRKPFGAGFQADGPGLH